MGKAAKEGARKEEPVGLALYLKKIKEGPEANWTKVSHWEGRGDRHRRLGL